MSLLNSRTRYVFVTSWWFHLNTSYSCSPTQSSFSQYCVSYDIWCIGEVKWGCVFGTPVIYEVCWAISSYSVLSIHLHLETEYSVVSWRLGRWSSQAQRQSWEFWKSSTTKSIRYVNVFVSLPSFASNCYCGSVSTVSCFWDGVLPIVILNKWTWYVYS